MNYEMFKEYMPEIRRLLIEKIGAAQSPVEIFDVLSGLPRILEQAKELRVRDETLSA